jgi:hypothetical protein
MAVIAFGVPSRLAEATVLGAEVALAAQKSGSGDAERRGGPIDDMAGAAAQDLVAAGAIVGTEPEPRGEVRLGSPAGHVEAHFADEGLGDPDIDAVDAREIDAADAGEFVPQIKLRRLRSRLAGRPAGRRLRGVAGGARFVGDGVQVRFERPVALDDALPVGVVEVDFLLQDEEELGLPRAFEAAGDVCARGVNARVAEGGEGRGIALAVEDGAHDGLPGAPGEVADHIGELDVHLRERPLHPLDTGGERADVIAALAPVGAGDADVGRRMKGIPQQARRSSTRGHQVRTVWSCPLTRGVAPPSNRR